MGDRYSICDPYLFTLSQWLDGDGVDVKRFPKLVDLQKRMNARPAVQRALAAERA